MAHHPPKQVVRPAWHRRVLTHVLDRALDGTEGKLTNAKWATIGKCSADTALCDINGLLTRWGLGRLGEGVRDICCQIGL